jgi:hypothetical protein
MKKKQELPITLPPNILLHYLVRSLYSIINFVKASITSLAVIAVILVLLSQMDQAYTMFIYILEADRFSLFVCFLMVNLLALSLSHYPIYLYYAGNLNGSREHIVWVRKFPLKFSLTKWIRVYVFRIKSNSRYTKDIYSNILRNYIGLFLFLVWLHFIVSTFEPVLTFPVDYRFLLKSVVYSISEIPFLIYFLVKRKLSPLHSNVRERKKIYETIGRWYVFFAFSSIVLFILVLVLPNMFSLKGMILIFALTLCLMFHFILFRLVRPRMLHVLINMSRSSRPISGLILTFIKSIGQPENYLVIFQIAFYGCLISIFYFNLASMYAMPLPNGLCIVLIYTYFYFFILSSIVKFYFVYFSIAKTENKDESSSILNRSSFKAVTFSLLLITILFVFSFFTESSVNSLDKVEIRKTEVPMKLSEFEDSLKTSDNTIFFVSSHGGGLKANVWTLQVLNELNKNSKGKFLDRTMVMSGASGGSLGLALFGDIVGTCENDQTKIDKTISKLEKENFASIDISMLLGLDAIRVLFPLNAIKGSKDRSYFDMLKYENIIHGTKNQKLNTEGYRSYWNDLQDNGVKLPMLIMNTASTSGRRGIFWTIKSDAFNDIFPFAINLAELEQPNGRTMTIPFYQALSTTNRFPIFSPVAKIKGSGHFMDAGAIDNSGLLGCLDVYLYYDQIGKLKGKKVVFVDIVNSKSLYADHLLQKYLKTIQNSVLSLDENEKLSLVANLQTGLNIDKIPRYLSDFMKKYTKTKSTAVYKQIFLPHKISIDDIEVMLDARIQEGKYKEDLLEFLKVENFKILSDLKENEHDFDYWRYYDPVLCRQLSQSNLRYFSKIKKSSLTGLSEVLKLTK